LDGLRSRWIRPQSWIAARPVGVHHHGGVEAADLAGGGHFAGEPAVKLRVAGVGRVHHLDRHLAPAARLPQEHPAHAALAEAAHQPERTNLTRVAGLQPIHCLTPGKARKTQRGDCPKQ